MMFSVRRFLDVACGSLLAVMLAGCSDSGFRAAPGVSGVITLNGQPLPKATVSFQPVAKGNPGPPSSSLTDDDGRFTLMFGDGKKGAVVGKHRVLISTRTFGQRSDNPDAEEERSPELVPDAYRTEPPTFEVPSGGTDQANFDLKGPPPGKAPAHQQDTGSD